MYLPSNNIYYGYFRVYGFKGLSKIFVARTRKGICFIKFSKKCKIKKYLKKKLNKKVLQNSTVFKDIMDALTGYFAGKPTHFKTPVDLSTGTPFQQRVWRKLIEIPYGEVRTYKWVAKEIGLPKGVRAVGQACGSNPVPIIVPCHRVIRADGSLGGYSSGVALKKELLKLEGLLF